MGLQYQWQSPHWNLLCKPSGQRVSLPASEQESELDPWTAKDLRRTATNILTRLGIPQEKRFLLQSREDGSVESKHYDHDDRLQEKREAARIYTTELERIIEGRELGNLVDMDEYRKSIIF